MCRSRCICRRGSLPSRHGPRQQQGRPAASTVPLVSSIGAVPHVLDRSRGRPPRDYAASINAILDVALETKFRYVKVVPGRAISSRSLDDSKFVAFASLAAEGSFQGFDSRRDRRERNSRAPFPLRSLLRPGELILGKNAGRDKKKRDVSLCSKLAPATIYGDEKHRSIASRRVASPRVP